MRCLTSIGMAAALVCGAAAAQTALAAPSPLRLCADPANLPFSSNAAGAAPGLYVEIGQAVAQALGRPLETVWSNSTFGKRNLRATLLAGQCDLAVGLPALPQFMGPRLLYTRPILTLGYALVVAQDRAVAGVDDLAGQRVAVQFGTPPQSLLAAREDITAVTTMDPEEAMRRLAAGEVDAAFIWAASAGWINQAALQGRFKLVPVDAPQMQFPAAIGVSSKRPELRDEIDAALAALAPRVQEIGARYALAMGPADSITVTDAGPVRVAAAGAADTDAAAGDVAKGKELFNGTCAHCHGPNAVVEDRKINLRRLAAKYGEQMDATYLATVTDGRPSKGMPAWKQVFTPGDFVDILSYLKTLQEK